VHFGTASKSVSQVEKASPETRASKASSILSESSLRTLPSKRDSLNFELMDDFEDMERLANSQSQPLQSVSGSEHMVEAAVVFSGVDDATYQLRIAGLEEALAGKDRDLEAANQMCHELSKKVAVAEEQLLILQTKNAANEQSVLDLQYQLDSLLESQAQRSESDGELALAVQKLIHIAEALAQATGTESATATLDHHETSPSMSNSVVLSLHWQDPTLATSMNNLVPAANAFLQTGADVLKFFLELTTTLDCILIIHIAANEELRKDRHRSAEERLAVSMDLESARVQVSQLEEEMCRIRAEQATAEMKIQVEMARFPQFEAEIMQLKKDKIELEHNLSEMDQHLVEANGRVEGLRVRLSEAEAIVTDLQTRQVLTQFLFLCLI
jgi:chromosome segregation ATPase